MSFQAWPVLPRSPVQFFTTYKNTKIQNFFYKIVIVKLVIVKVVVWTSMAPKHCRPRHADIRVLVYPDPDPVIILKRFDLKHCGVGASLSECGKEFHRWQPLFKKVVAQRLDLCGMGINRFGHVVIVFGGYAFVELVQTYQPSIQGNFYV